MIRENQTLLNCLNVLSDMFIILVYFPSPIGCGFISCLASRTSL